MNSVQFYQLLSRQFPFSPTYKQDVFFREISEFVTDQHNDSIFVLKGYAGTGKNNCNFNHCQQLTGNRQKVRIARPNRTRGQSDRELLAETGLYDPQKIYFPKKTSGGGVGFTLQPNKNKNTVFIVDEASMISDSASDNAAYANGSLLDDLISYIYSGKDCKMILLGDTAQLPPVNLDVSPALDTEKLALHYQKEVKSIEFDEVMRQEEQSGILSNATELRELLKDDFITDFQFDLKGFKDIVRLSDGYDIQDAINSSYSNYSIEDTAFIVRSNKRANAYNQQIRTRILDKESELSTGDYLMVVKNNYFWLKETDQAGFIANGDIVEVLELFGIIEIYTFKFAKVKIRMVDYPNQKPLETVLLLDTLTSESPSLTYDESNRLYQEVMKDYEDERAAFRRLQKVKENEYFNALQVKFSYAITCHKSQGGQWNTVFVEQPYLPDGIDRDYIRWLYTAITRAKDKLYLIGFKDENFVAD